MSVHCQMSWLACTDIHGAKLHEVFYNFHFQLPHDNNEFLVLSDTDKQDLVNDTSDR